MNRPEVDLHLLAVRAMRERGLDPDFAPDVQRQVERMSESAHAAGPEIRDLRELPWCSIDNDDSRDLDQLSVGEPLGDGVDLILVAIADVDALVKRGSAVDSRARHNTTSVYTPGGIFPMLPERLSTDLTSLNPGEDRLAVVISYTVREDGSTVGGELFRALVRNKAQLAYDSVSAWLDGVGPMPGPMADVPGLDHQIRRQEAASDRLRALRFERGALELETIEPHAVVVDGKVTEFRPQPKNRARELIEDFMIAANGVVAQFLTEQGYPTLRRVVDTPERWDRIETLARQYGESLPPDPSSRALAGFLRRRRRADPLRFPDLSLTIIKLLGPGEYAVNFPGDDPIGHFGLAVRDYSHSTAPNRRYPDLITQRLIKGALENRPVPFGSSELQELAQHCTEQEDAARKVERQVTKSAAALLLADRIGEEFDALVTGKGKSGTWVRTIEPPVEGRLEQGYKNVDVGDRVRVRLLQVDVERGFIDFARQALL